MPDELQDFLIAGRPGSFLPMMQHQINVLRGWSQLAYVAKAGYPSPRLASIRGPFADRAAFVAAMHSISGPIADELVGRLPDWPIQHLLDVGGASGTWTLAWLRRLPAARATIFDLPDAIDQAKARVAASEFADRITLAAGDFYDNELPGGVDFAWVSAIVHQHSRAHNRALFEKCHRASCPAAASPSATSSWNRAAPSRSKAPCSPSTCWPTPRPAARSRSKNWPTIWRPAASASRN